MSARPSVARPLPLLYSVTTASRLLGLSRRVVSRMIAQRELPSVQLGKTYVPRLELEKYLQSLPTISSAEAIANLGRRITAMGRRAERIEVE